MSETTGWGRPPAPYMNEAARPRRHPRETLLLIICTVFAVLFMVVGVFGMAEAITSKGKNVPQSAILVLVPLFILFFRALARAVQRMNSVKISPTQFPQAYAAVADAARHFGLKHMPDAYVMLGNGMLNAFAGAHGRRRYIVITSDMFEIGGQARNPEALRFVIGHEVGHLAAGHASYWRGIVLGFTIQVPVFGPTFSRAQEYTADNHGHAFCPEGSATAMGALGAGKYLLGLVDFHALADRASTERGFFAWLVNVLSTHPVLIWRAAALRDRSRPGRLLFRPRQRPQPPAFPPAQAPYDHYPQHAQQGPYPQTPVPVHFTPAPNPSGG